MSDMNVLMIPEDEQLAASAPLLMDLPTDAESAPAADAATPDEDYLERVRVAAYYIAEKYQFLRDPARDWEEAEAQIKAERPAE
jgi:hypothetical protein